MIRATHIARPRKLKHTKQRLSSNLRRRSRPALSAANQTWRVGTDAALGPNFAPHVQCHGGHATLHVGISAQPEAPFPPSPQPCQHTRYIRFLECSAGFRLARRRPPPQRIAHAEA